VNGSPRSTRPIVSSARMSGTGSQFSAIVHPACASRTRREVLVLTGVAGALQDDVVLLDCVSALRLDTLDRALARRGVEALVLSAPARRSARWSAGSSNASTFPHSVHTRWWWCSPEMRSGS